VLAEGGLKGPARAGATALLALYDDLAGRLQEPLDLLFARLLDKSGYLSHLEASSEQDFEERRANVLELGASAAAFGAAERGGLLEYLSECSLLTDADRLSEGTDRMLMLTVHNAKGLEFDAVAIAYGLCNRGIIGLTAKSLAVVIPRAHDCIGMLLGSSRCYFAQLEAQPGTYFQSAGWLENSPLNGEIRKQNFTFGPNSNVTRAALVDKYGEENADFLIEQFANFTRHYKRLAFIDTPVPTARKWEGVAREIAEKQGWQFDRLAGDLAWLRRLLDAEWNEDEFLRLEPGQRVVMRSDAQLIGAEPA